MEQANCSRNKGKNLELISCKNLSRNVIFLAEKRVKTRFFLFKMSYELINIIEPFLEDGQILMDINHDVRGNFIRIIVDSESALTLDDTAKLTRSIKNAIETLSEIPDGVRIEVSTPGLDCSLSEPFQFKKNLNRKLEVVYDDNRSSIKIMSIT